MDFNSNLNNLFTNYQNQQNYKKKKFDVNGDGKINSKDQTQLTNNEKSLLKSDNLFDLNNDGKVDVNDMFFASQGVDIDGNGKVDDLEKAFLKNYKSKITKEISNKIGTEAPLSIQDLVAYEEEISKMSASDKKFWQSEIKSFENKMIDVLSNKKNVSVYEVVDVFYTVKDMDMKAKLLGNNSPASTTYTKIMNSMAKNLSKDISIEELLFFEENIANVQAEISDMANDRVPKSKRDSFLKSFKTLENAIVKNLKANVDIDGDGKTTMEDLSALWETTADVQDVKLFNGKQMSAVLKDLQANMVTKIKAKNVNYDFNKDGKVDINDVANGDLNNDGKTSLAEEIFLKNQESDIVKNVLKPTKFTGDFNNKHYVSGKVADGTITEGSKKTVYKKGVFQYSVEYNCAKDYPKVKDGKLQFNKNGSERFSVKLNVGDVAVINADGTVKITDVNGQEKEYDKYGILAEHSVENNLSGLLENYTAQKRKIDITGNAKFNDADKERLSANEERILKNKLLFDVDGDGKLTQADIDKFLEGDIDGDGKTSDLEKAFVKEYKDELKAAFTKAKADFNLDNKQYFDGAVASGVEKDGLHYTNGAKTNGDVGNQLYIDGQKSTLTGEHTNGKYYVNGLAANGLQENGLHYTNGAKTNGINSDNYYSKFDSFMQKYNYTFYANDSLAEGLINGTMFQGGKPATGIIDGSFYINGEFVTDSIDNKLRYLDRTGSLINGCVCESGHNTAGGRININGYSVNDYDVNDWDRRYTLYENGTPFYGEKDGVLFIAGDPANGVYGGITYKNGKVVGNTSIIYNKYEYSKAFGELYQDGKLADGIVDGKMYQAGFLCNGEKDGKMYQSGELVTGIVDGSFYVNGDFVTDSVDNQLRYFDRTGAVIDGCVYEYGHNTACGRININGYHVDDYDVNDWNRKYTLYENGIPFYGEKDGVLFVAGNPANGEYGGKTYKNGKVVK